MINYNILFALLLLMNGLFSVFAQNEFKPVIPKHYITNKINEEIDFDGKPLEKAWERAEWTDLFQDIEGVIKPDPFFDTRVKIIWDDEFIYFYAEMEEEHVWADITERDEVIFYNNDFEIFMKPYTNATHYGELEVNALGTVWDLLLMNAYREGGPIINDWDLKDLNVGVHIDGKINNSKGKDRSWALEIGVPWSSLDELIYGKKHKSLPDPWRINFSRVQWDHELIKGKYSKKKGRPEHNWVWCEQSAVDMHRPEHWGYLLFNDGSQAPDNLLEWQEQEDIRQYLFYLYREQKNYAKGKFMETGEWRYASSLEMLDTKSYKGLIPLLNVTSFGFEIYIDHQGERITVNEQGQLAECKLEPFVFAAWMHGDKNRTDEEWLKEFKRAKSVGISDLFIGGGADELRRYIRISDSLDLNIHGWVWTLNRPGDSIARQHPEWYAVNRKGLNSLEYNAYVGYYQWLSPFSEGAREHIKNNIKEIAQVQGLASVHLDYVRFCDVILGKALQPKYDLVQTTEMPEYDYGYHPNARKEYEAKTGIDPMELDHPELSTEWRQFRLNAVTSLVNELSVIAHNNDKKISAAVFPFPEMSRTMVRQDWSNWNIDIALPMIYHNFYDENLNWIQFATEQGVKELDSRFPLYTGLYIPSLSPEELEIAIQKAKYGGAKGACLFEFTGLSEQHLSVIRKFGLNGN